MTIKLLGAVLIISGCGGFGFMIARNYLAEERTLKQFIWLLDYMECELQYRLTALPSLCRQAAGQANGILRTVFLQIATELEDQICPDVKSCVEAVVQKHGASIPKITKQMLLMLGASMGRFDLEGQIRGLEAVRTESRRQVELLCADKDQRVRSYQALGICAGAALVILFI